MDKIVYNEPNDGERRVSACDITFEEEKEAIRELNKLCSFFDEFSGDAKISFNAIQKFVDNYQNLLHFKDISVGLYATDKEEYADKEDFFILEF